MKPTLARNNRSVPIVLYYQEIVLNGKVIGLFEVAYYIFTHLLAFDAVLLVDCHSEMELWSRILEYFIQLFSFSYTIPISIPISI